MKREPTTPHNVEAEEALLGSLLIDPSDAVPRVAKWLRSGDFYIQKNAWIYEAILDLHRRKDAIDFVTIADVLEVEGHLDDVGGVAYLTHLLNAVPSAVNIGSYAWIVRRAATNRQLLVVASAIAKQAYQEEDDIDALDRAVRAKAAELVATLPARPKSQWTLRTLVDAYAPRDPITHIVGDGFALPSLSIVYGAPDTLKSLLLLDMTISVAAGLMWLEPLPDDKEVCAFQTVQVPALWLDFDNGERRTDNRVEAIARARDLQADTLPFYYVSMPNPWLDASDTLSVEKLEWLMRENNIGLVAIDNLRTVSGSVDENAPEIANVMSNLRRLAENTSAAVIVIHHERKSTGWDRRAGEALRGHSSIEAALDLALLVSRVKGSDDIVEVHSTKSRDMNMSPFGALFTYEHYSGTTDLRTARFFGQAIKDDDRRAELAILATVEDEPEIMKGSLVEAVKVLEPGVGINRIRAAIDRLVRQDRLEMRLGERNAQHYFLPR